jgi:hypothetical protein
MAHRPGKELDEQEYHSQPVAKSSRWILDKFRRPKKHKGSPSFEPVNPPDQASVDKPQHTVEEDVENPTMGAQENPPVGAQENPTDQPFENQQRADYFILATDDESRNWSPNVVEFYNNGDVNCCFSSILGTRPLGQNFFGTLLGYRNNGRLRHEVNFLHLSFF